MERAERSWSNRCHTRVTSRARMTLNVVLFSLSLLVFNGKPVIGNNMVISSLVTKLGLGQIYVTEPCRLMPFVELSPLLAMNSVNVTDADTVKRAQRVYYEIGLSGMLYAGCLMTKNMGETKASAVLRQWVSGYANANRKQVMTQNFRAAIDDGKAATTDKECLQKSIARLRNAQVSKNPDGLITDELRHQRMVMQGKAFTPTELKAATETVALECLTATAGLDDQAMASLVGVLVKAARFFHHIEGGVLRTIVGPVKQADVLQVLLVGIVKANYLNLQEKNERLKLIFDGDVVSSQKCMNKGVEECIKLITSV